MCGVSCVRVESQSVEIREHNAIWENVFCFLFKFQIRKRRVQCTGLSSYCRLNHSLLLFFLIKKSKHFFDTKIFVFKFFESTHSKKMSEKLIVCPNCDYMFVYCPPKDCHHMKCLLLHQACKRIKSNCPVCRFLITNSVLRRYMRTDELSYTRNNIECNRKEQMLKTLRYQNWNNWIWLRTRMAFKSLHTGCRMQVLLEYIELRLSTKARLLRFIQPVRTSIIS